MEEQLMDYYYGSPDRNCFPQKESENRTTEPVQPTRTEEASQHPQVTSPQTVRQQAHQADQPSDQPVQQVQPEPPTQQPNIITNSGGQFKSPLVQPNFNTEEMRGSMQQILAENVGEYVVIEFLIGTERLMRKQGLLYFVGRSYVTLYDDSIRNYIVCDLFSIKFVYFYYPGDRPRRNYNILPVANGSGGNGR